MRAGDTVGTGQLADGSTREAFAGWPMLFGWAAMLIFACHACTHMVAAGDTWVAMACGRHFVNHGVDTVEPFSANSHKAGPTEEEVKTWPTWAQWITDKVGLETVRYWHPTGWVNQNWLTHVIFYRLSTALGSESEPYYNALVLWKFTIYILAAAALYYTARIYGVNPALAAIFVSFSLFIGRSFFDVRPAGFSNLLVAVLILVLALASYRSALYIWLIVPLIVFWSNVHGGYVYAFIALVAFIVWHAIVRLPRRWTVATYSILLWLVLYGMANRFYHHKLLTPIPVQGDWLFYLVVIGIVVGIALSWSRKVADSAVISYHVTVSCVLFLSFLTRFFPAVPVGLNRLERGALEVHIASSRLAYIGIFSFAMVVAAVLVFLKEKVVRTMEWWGTLHTVAATVVAFIAMVVFNPFHLTNLTHTFVISVSRNAERWRDVHEWHRAFDWSNPVGTAKPFLVMYILAWLVLLVWVVVFVRTSRLMERPVRKKAKMPVDFAWPRIDLALLVIAAMTIYMAIRSRRFIPIAAFAACPIVALLIDQVVRLVAATVQFSRVGKFEVPPMPARLQSWFVLAGAAAVTVFGVWSGLKFKYVYLDYWPADPKLSSVFMRMTASDAKPFYACEFIRSNQLSGKMFNYWTEGGFIAWGQDPDPETGKTPLQLFMDGRAQAAYNVATFDRWTDIMSGGPIVSARRTANSRLTAKDYVQVGKWVGEQLRQHDVWLVMMPNNQFDKPLTNGLEYSTDWRIVFMNDKQKVFVDVNSPKGAGLYQDMLTGKLTYPDEYSADLTLGHNLLLFVDPARKRNGLELVISAFNMQPSPAPMLEMLLIAAQFAELQPRIDEVCAQYVLDFEDNKAAYANEDGYNLRLEAARLALIRLEQVARANGDAKSAEAYRQRIDRCEAERDRISLTKRW